MGYCRDGAYPVSSNSIVGGAHAHVVRACVCLVDMQSVRTAGLGRNGLVALYVSQAGGLRAIRSVSDTSPVHIDRAVIPAS